MEIMAVVLLVVLAALLLGKRPSEPPPIRFILAPPEDPQARGQIGIALVLIILCIVALLSGA